MNRSTDKEINRAALRYSLTLTAGLVTVIGLNTIAAFKYGYDVRDLEWWLISPALTIFITYIASKLAIK